MISWIYSYDFSPSNSPAGWQEVFLAYVGIKNAGLWNFNLIYGMAGAEAPAGITANASAVPGLGDQHAIL